MSQFALAHIALTVRDLERSIAFYRLLDGEVTERCTVVRAGKSQAMAMVAVGGVLLELIQPPAGGPAGGAGPWNHVALRVDGVAEAGERLRRAGVGTFETEAPVELPGVFGGLRNWFLAGPDGERLELLEPLKAEGTEL